MAPDLSLVAENSDRPAPSAQAAPSGRPLHSDSIHADSLHADSLRDDRSGDQEAEPAPPLAARYVAGPEIARGGMGAIYQVWDQDLGRTLAMKVLLDSHGAPDAGLVQRFIREARITGQLDHPGIVPVHEMGLDDAGRIYFTMRLVRGQDLGAVFAAAHAGTGGWSRTRALEVLLKICDTMAYAHARSVVHRDLKPLNVMVGDFGEVTVLDWGLAKVIDDPTLESAPGPHPPVQLPEDDAGATLVGAVLGTPSYMSPEQAAGQAHRADRRVDVYALGAMLYTLLAGRPPYATPGRRDSARDLVAAVRAGPPTALRELAPGVPEDLATVCERAMQREPEARFASAAEMADAVRAHLERERLAAEDGRRLRSQLDDARGVAEFLKGLFRVEKTADAEKPVSMVEILTRGAQRIDQDLAAQPAMRASVHATIGDVFSAIGAYPQAVPHLEVALAAAAEHRSAAHTGTSGAGTAARTTDPAAPAPPSAGDLTYAHRLTSYACALQSTGQFERAEQLLQDAVALWRQLGAPPEPLARALTGLISLYWHNGRKDLAKPIIAEAVSLRRQLPDEAVLGSLLLQQGVFMDTVGDIETGEAALREALEIHKRHHGPRHTGVGLILNNMAVVAGSRRDYALAMQYLEEALEIRVETMGPRHLQVALILMNLGYFEHQLGQHERAEELLRESLSIRCEALDPEHPLAGHTHINLANALTAQGKLADADEHLLRAAHIADTRVDAEHPLHVWLASARARWYETQDRQAEAEAHYLTAVERFDRASIPLGAQTGTEHLKLAEYYMRQQRPRDAEPILTELAERYARCFRPHDPIRRDCETLLAQARAARHDR